MTGAGIVGALCMHSTLFSYVVFARGLRTLSAGFE